MASKTTPVTTTQNVTQTSTPYGAQAPYLSDVWSRAQYVSNMGAPDWTQTISDMRGAAGNFRSAADSYAGLGTSPLYIQAANYFGNVARGDYLSPNSNPFFQGMVDQSIMAARPSVDSAFASSGRLGSGAQAAAFSDAATRAATALGYQNYQNERGYQNQANSLLPQVAAMPAGWMQQAGGARQTAAGLEQAAGTLPQDYEYQNLGKYSGLVGPPIMSNSTGTKTGTEPVQQANPFMQGAGALFGGLGSLGQLGQGASGLSSLASGIGGLFGGGGAALSGSAAGLASVAPALAAGTAGTTAGSMLAMFPAAFLASDARLKENIKPVGALNNGLTVYSYNYKGDHVPHIGLLAQEVAQTKPEAVGHIGGGLLGVNYAEAVT